MAEITYMNELTFGESDCEPWISQNTIYYHYHQHHFKYQEKMLAILKEKASSLHLKIGTPLEDIIRISYKANALDLYNNASQVWNHNFYWDIIQRGVSVTDEMTKIIKSSFGNFDKFVAQMKDASNTIFGGWLWVCINNTKDKLYIKVTKEADCPIVCFPEDTPVLVVDLWEHAYYLDYQNRKSEYLENFLRNLVNWHRVEELIK